MPLILKINGGNAPPEMRFLKSKLRELGYRTEVLNDALEAQPSLSLASFLKNGGTTLLIEKILITAENGRLILQVQFRSLAIWICGANLLALLILAIHNNSVKQGQIAQFVAMFWFAALLLIGVIVTTLLSSIKRDLKRAVKAAGP